MTRVALACALVLLVGACSSTSTAGNDSTDHGWGDCSAASTADIPALGEDPADWVGQMLALEPVADVPKATSLTELNDGRLLVTSQTGQLWLVDGEEQTVVLDLEDVVSHGVEQGLIDVVHMNGLLLVSYTDLVGDLVVRSYESPDGVTLGAFDEVIKVKQPHEWHNSGAMEEGPDGYLYLGLGDGGGIADPGRNGQDTTTLLGTIVRIDPYHGGYDIPKGAPFGTGFFSSDREEIVAYGLRNPWRFTFDSQTGDMWIGDVGQGCVEEVDFVAADSTGQNFGWPRLEGSYQFMGDEPAEHSLPVFEYLHKNGGCSVTGGYVYRGADIAELEGMYVLADYCRGRLIGLEQSNGVVSGAVMLGPEVRFLTSFGQGSDGELYVLTGDEGVFRLVLATQP